MTRENKGETEIRNPRERTHSKLEATSINKAIKETKRRESLRIR